MQKHTYLLLLLISFFTINTATTYAVLLNEICNNGIDDDLDGLTDCADPDCEGDLDNCSDTFACSNGLYQVISGVLNRFNPLTSSYEVIGDSGMGGYNGSAYNVEDGYFYGIKSISGANSLLRINNQGVATDLGAIVNWTGGNYYADIDTSGNWVSYTGGLSPSLRMIDIDVSPPTLTTSSLTNLYGNSIPTCADITFNAVTKKYYGMSKDFELVEIDPTAMTIDVIADYEGTTNNFGAAWSDIEGNSYFSNNGTGEITAIRFDTNGNPTNLGIVAQGQVTNSNDGMNCILALPPFETDCSDGIDNDGDGLIDSADPDCTDTPDFTLLTGDPTITDVSNSWGIAWTDFNNDCYDDLFVPSYDPNVPSTLYVNNGDGSFTKVTSSSLVTDTGPSLTASWADFNNDGYTDVVVANNVGSNSFLYTNNPTYDFTRAETGDLAIDDNYSHSVSFVDYDNDGFVDIFLTDYFSSNFNQLYRNKGDGTFEKITSGIIVNDALNAIGTTWGDVNGDGFQDAFVPVHDGSNVLYINNGDRSFTKMEMGDNGTSVGSSFGDYDNDGDLDLFVTNASGENNFLYQNDGNGNFTQITAGYIANDGGNSHGSAWGDFDNDGWLDLYVTNDQEQANFLYINNSDGTFSKVLNSPLVAANGNSFGVATSDLDNDGDLDIAVANHTDENNDIYINGGNNNNYINILLTGTNSNASAIGARIYVTATIDGQEITQMREVSGQTGGGPGSQSSLTQHFGLDDAAFVSEIKIEWPSGYVQTMTNVSTNQKLMISEENGSLISGTVFNDINGNCVQDAGEYGMPNTMITLQPGSIFALTDENGYYEAYVSPANYTVTQQTPENYTTTCPVSNSYNVNVPSIGNTYPNNDFANLASAILPDLGVDIGVTALRRGFENDMTISYSNHGVVAATDVILTLTMDSDVSAAFSDVPWTSVEGNVYQWNLGRLEVNESGVINLLDYVDLNATLDTYKTFTATITSAETDLDTKDNMAQTSEKIVGAVDPNDILVKPIGYGPQHLIQPSDTLIYRIRFQNVGNYEAARVVVIDTLPEYIDMSSLKLGAVSHPYQFKISEGNIVTWNFNDINLIDSTTNEAASHGFIQFKVLLKKDVPQHTRIENRAAIQFDYNAFIITNTVFNTIDYDLKVEDINKPYLFIYPNPASSYVNMYLQYPSDVVQKTNAAKSLDTGNHFEGTVRIYTHQGLLIDEKTINDSDINHSLYLSIQHLDAGFYIISVSDANGESYTGRFLKH